jgi:hypothetical protein
MASVVSKLKTADIAEDTALTANLSTEQVEQWLEQGKGILRQDVVDIVASIVNVAHGHK